jgi:hypothetical protein
MRLLAAMIGAIALAGCETASDLGAPKSPPPILLAEKQVFAEAIRAQLADVRYMEGDCTEGSFPSWEGLALE